MRRCELRFVIIASAVLMALYVAMLVRYSVVIDGTRYFTLTDDQMISMRYAENLAAGRGLVWNPGERVEGASNPLWTLYMAAWHLPGLAKAKISLAIAMSGAVLLLINALLCASIARRLFSRSFLLFALTFLATALYWPLVRWTLEGFEVGLVAVLTSAAFLLLLRYREEQDPRYLRGLALVLVALAFTRLDALPIAGIGLYPLLLRADSRRRAITRVALPVAVALVLLFVARHSYFGEWWPNTYYLKLTGVSLAQRLPRGLDALSSTFSTHLAPLLAIVVLGLVAATIGRKAAPILASFATAALYTVYIGGDTWENEHLSNRFLAAVVPLVVVVGLGILWSWSQRLLSELGRTRLFMAVATMALIASLGAADFIGWLRVDVKTWRLFDEVRLGVFFKSHVPRETRIAVTWAGALPYFSELPGIDLLGKMDKTIAHSRPHNITPGHNKWNYEYSIGQLRPDVVIELFDPQPADLRHLSEWGYEHAPEGWFVRRDGLAYEALIARRSPAR